MRWICFDLETVARADAAQFLQPPSADKRLTDPEKIAADIEKKAAKQRDEMSLDWNLNQIVALGFQNELMDGPRVFSLDRFGERDMLDALWAEAKGRKVIGYRSRTFDIPTALQRGRLLGLPVTNRWRDLVGKWGKGDAIDLFDELTFDDPREATSCTPRTLSFFCNLFGLEVPEDDVDGAQIAELVKAERWDDVRSHCHADVAKTVALARRLGVIPALEPAGAF